MTVTLQSPYHRLEEYPAPETRRVQTACGLRVGRKSIADRTVSIASAGEVRAFFAGELSSAVGPYCHECFDPVRWDIGGRRWREVKWG